MPQNFCPNCGSELQYKEVEVCPKCGVRIKPQLTQKPTKSTGRNVLVIVAIVVVVFIGFIILSAVIAAFVFGMAGGVSKTKSVAATAKQVGNDIFVTWQGGQDNSLVYSYQVILKDTATSDNFQPIVGEAIGFSGGTTGNDHVVVIATFTDGTQQVVLDTYV